MGIDTGIGWTHHTFSPWEGCVKISPGCDNCYAEERDGRFHGGDNWGKNAPRLFHSEAYWRQLAKWNKLAAAAGERRRVFCASLCDVMEDRHDLDPWRAKLWDHIEDCPDLDFLLLTKRPQNFRRLLPERWLKNPLPNVWGMTTVESQQYAWRAIELINTPFAVRGISAEPLLGELNLTGVLDKIDWVICGGESGRNARPMEQHWALFLKQQCEAAGAKFFMKQLGGFPDKRHNLVQFPTELRVQQFPQTTTF